VGIGTYTAPSTLARTAILASSNAGNIVTSRQGKRLFGAITPQEKLYIQMPQAVSLSPLSTFQALQVVFQAPITFNLTPLIQPHWA